VVWAKSFGGTGDEIIQYAVADIACEQYRSSSDSTDYNLIKSAGWNGIVVYGVSNSVQFKVPTDPPVSRANHDTTGKTNDIFVVKLNVTNGDPWMSMMIGGSKNEGFYDSFKGDVVKCDTYALVWTESDTYNWAGAEEVAQGSARYQETRMNTKDSWIIRWRGYSIYSTTLPTNSQATRYIAVPGTNPVIYRVYDYTTQALTYWNGKAPTQFVIEAVSSIRLDNFVTDIMYTNR
jgi:hypothetical protein